MAGAPPTELDVAKATGTTYKNFIESWRADVATSMRTHDVPMLIQYQNPPARTFDVVLRTRDSAITLRIRADDLYLMGYRVNGQDQWYEFKNEKGERLIPGSVFLPFGRSYSSLLGDNSAVVREQTNLGRQQLETAVNTIATSPNTDGAKKPLAIVIQMICEAIRFTKISDHVVNNFDEGRPPTALMVHLENNWSAVSKALRRVDANPTAQFLPPHNLLAYTTPAEVAAVLGVAMYYCFRSSHIAATRAGTPPMADGQCLVFGRPLVEVYQVRINDIDGEDPGDLYGKITVTDGLLGSRDMYNVERSNAQSVSPRDFVLLTGPPRAIEAGDSFTIDVALMDRDRLSPDDEVSKGEISWTFFNGANVFDKVIYQEIKGKYGSATVNYIVFSDAVTATVEVKLINGDKENPADVYGLIVAKNSDFQDESTLFKKGSEEDIDVRPGELIPLSRSVVAVSSNSSLRITAHLWDRDRDASPDDEIANGTADFPVQLSGTYQNSITGKYGEVQVNVTWA